MAIQSKTAFLEHFPLFETLNPDEKLRLTQMVEVKVKPRFSYIYLPGEASDKIFFLSKGTVAHICLRRPLSHCPPQGVQVVGWSGSHPI